MGRTRRVAINGFGRIGRLILRAAIESGRKDLSFVAINDFGTAEVNAHLLMHDTVHGTLKADVFANDGRIRANGYDISVFTEVLPHKLPWADLDVDIVFECTGRLTTRDAAAAHIEAGAKRVLISAPSRGADKTIVYGVNHHELTEDDSVVSNASCTTNCLVPVVKVLDDLVGVERGFMTTVHALTGDQRPLDAFHQDYLLARAAGANLIPTTTGAAKAVGLVLPRLMGRLEGAAIRVPTLNVSLIDLKVDTNSKTTPEEINRAYERVAAQKAFRGVLQVNKVPLVSADFNHNPASAVVDLAATTVVDSRMVRVLAWYDNEWGFANRMLDTATVMGGLIAKI
ncbi:MAG: type I glyceraldehyde-3-phosphate dehydrogenase [Hyphomicrobium sp.]